MHFNRWLLALLICGSTAFRLAAHEGPEHEIEVISEKIKISGESAGLLADRAIEYRLLGKLAEAIKDLERAVVLEPESMVIHRALAHALYQNGKADDALATISRGLRGNADEPAEVAALRILRADILRSKKDYGKALEDANAAIVLHNGNPEWYILRSDIQRLMKAHKERLAGIEAGIKATGAWILELERVEALIDAGNLDVALPIIESELQDSRIKSSWLIRRARVRQAQGKQDDAVEDLKSALAEIGTRLNPKTPDLPLLLDKARALEMLGDSRDALDAYKTARDKGADDSLKDKIKALEESTSKPAAPDAPGPKAQ
jgi:tetratricopeptide (TPR) repeat protein